MATAKTFKPEFRTRTGKRVSFGADYTHNTAAKRRAGRTKNGLPRISAVGAGTVVRRPRRWIPWAVLGVNSAAVGGAYAVSELGPVPGGLVIAGGLYVAYKVARWTVGEVAHWSVKARQIRGRDDVAAFASDGLPTARVPADTVNHPDARR
ncbi:hypothetical protein ACFYT5_13990 [Streptomyces anulatus]|uniref:Uncharacterized protein n=1 Tax=Streptomyces microflavus DSM 40593 TaxID=1303692 RepID=N0CWF3_STRMI|nr:hypothetical protein [Streptomyces microflavus]AGK80456.1 hypothetical protein SFUL_5568 [Streptomyces microflavus DSM 40593]